MPTGTRSRGTRDDLYTFDRLFAQVHRSAAGLAWRWRTEFVLLGTVGAAFGWLWSQLRSPSWAGLVLAAALGILLGVPWSRRFLVARFWCVLARHRFQRLCWEARLHTRAGRLPAVLWVTPTRVGERLFIWCRAGIAAEDFAQHTGELRAACYARDTRVTRNETWSHLVTIDIIRRDTLAARNTVHSPLKTFISHTGRTVAAPPPSPDGPASTVPDEVIPETVSSG